MIAHLVGTKPCRYVTSAAKRAARELRNVGTNAEDENREEAGPSKKKRKLFSNVKRTLIQTELKVYKGISIPFSSEQMAIINKQFLRATISANLPFRWIEDIEIVKLFLLFRSAVSEVIPERKVLAGPLLNEECSKVELQLKEVLKGRYGTLL
jgi:hypothetical protein